MRYNIVQTENYLLVGNDNNSKRGWFYCFRTKNVFKDEGEDVLCCNGDMNIIVHLPLNNSPILDGVDLLPPLEDEVNALYENKYDNFTDKYDDILHYYSFVEGYNTAKETYKYTREDLRKAISFCWFESKKEFAHLVNIESDFFKSLQQPKYPIAFECEITPMNIDEIREDGKGFLNVNTNKLVKRTNSEGKTQWAGKYIF